MTAMRKSGGTKAGDKTGTKPDTDDLLSIGDLADATGIAPDTIRAWERRYGRPEAVRLPSGHRRYTDAHVRWLRRVAEALSRGHRPSKVVGLDDEALTRLLDDGPEACTEPAFVAKLLASVKALDIPKVRRMVFADLERLGPRVLIRDRVGPILTAVGRAWADGELSIRHEHLASEVIQDVLRLARERLPTPRRGPLMVLTTLPEERHELGVQMAAIECAALGVRTRILGPDTPLEETASIATEVEADAVGISVSLATGGVKTDRQLAELRGLLPDGIRLVVGGAGARGVRRGPQGIEYAQDWEVLEAWLKDLVETHKKRGKA